MNQGPEAWLKADAQSPRAAEACRVLDPALNLLLANRVLGLAAFSSAGQRGG